MTVAHILIIDDEAAIRDSLGKILRYEDHSVDDAPDGQVGLLKLDKERYDLVFLDIKMPGIDGLETLTEIRKRKIETPVVIISGHGDVQTAVEATKLGAFDFLEKPLDADRILVTLRNALTQGRLRRDKQQLQEKLKGRHEIVGKTLAIREVMDAVEKVAPSEARVLITGDNGSGKELVAWAIHSRSRRAEGPFIEVNCAAIPNELIESELFGHEKGSFTGAHQRRRGRFEQAHGGTLFLDEVGDMSLEAQAKVLRVLQESRLERVGGTETLEVDVRIIAATNKDLLAEAAEHHFREDLYYRLNVVPIQVPPLRDRREDIPLLVAHFLERYSRELGVPIRKVHPDALEKLKNYRWPGNVRELGNMIERLLIMASGDQILEADIPGSGEAIGGDVALFEATNFQDFKERSEAAFLARKIKDWNGNVSQTARALGMQRSHLYRKIEKYGLQGRSSPDSDEE
ncbi:sigma-54-dependent Fis family transcriptional regulator [bacterium]|nr:sigma-54-dependent Fis family transcriptional regulator [bacterium]